MSKASYGHNTFNGRACSVLFSAALALIFISGCAEDPEASARMLYTQANDSLRAAKNESSYQKILLRFQVVKQLSTEIINSYPGTSTAAGMSSGELAIGEYTLDRLDEVRPTLLSLVEAEASLLDAAALAVYSEKGLQASSVINVAERLVERGNYQTAMGVLENLLLGEKIPTTFGASEIWGVSWNTDDVKAVLRIATLYYDMGEQQLGAKMLAYAKALRDDIDRDWWKPGDGQKEDSIANTYSYFAEAYLHFGLRDQALQVTNAAFDHYAGRRAYFDMQGDSIADAFLELGYPDRATEALDLHVEAKRDSKYGFNPWIAGYARLGKVDLALSLAEEMDNESTAISRYLRIARSLQEQGHNQRALQVSNRVSELVQKLDLSKTTNQNKVGELAKLQSSLGFQSEAIAVIEQIDDPVIYSRYFIELVDTESRKQPSTSTPSSSVDDSRSKKLIENLISNETLYFGSKPREIIELLSALIATNQSDLALQVLDRLSADFALERTEILASGEPLSQSNVDSADSQIARKYVLTGKVTEGVCRATAIADSYYLTKTLLDIEANLFETGDELSQDARNCLSRAVTRIVPFTKFWAL